MSGVKKNLQGASKKDTLSDVQTSTPTTAQPSTSEIPKRDNKLLKIIIFTSALAVFLTIVIVGFWVYQGRIRVLKTKKAALETLCPQGSFPQKLNSRPTRSSGLIKPIFASIASPHRLAFCFLEKPLANKSVKLLYVFKSEQDISNAKAKVELPESFSLLKGSLEWQGGLMADKKQTLELIIKAAKWGTYSFRGELLKDGRLAEVKTLPLHIAPDDVLFGYSLPKNRWYGTQTKGSVHSQVLKEPSSSNNQDIKSELIFSDSPKLNGQFTVSYQVTPLVNLPDFGNTSVSLNYPPEAFEMINIIFPQDGEVEEHPSQRKWKGAINKGQTVEIRATFKVTNTGWGAITGGLWSKQAEGHSESIFDEKVAHVYVNRDTGIYSLRSEKAQADTTYN